jgi:hypothetical protein
MTTILIIVVVLMLFGGGGYYGYRRRWSQRIVLRCRQAGRDIGVWVFPELCGNSPDNERPGDLTRDLIVIP